MNHFDGMTEESQAAKVEKEALKRSLIVEISQYGNESAATGRADHAERIAKIRALIDKL